MKITANKFKSFKKLYNKDTVGFSVLLTSAEEHFKKESSEHVLIPKLNPYGVSLILEYLDEKHKQKSNISVVDCTKDTNSLKETLQNFNALKDGSKMSLVIYDGSHWRTAYCERKEGKTHIAVFDSCGVIWPNNPVEEVINSTQKLKANTILYRSVNKLQAAENNCGIFAIRAAQRFCQEQDFFGKIQKGNLILTKEEAASHFKRSRQLFGDKQDKVTLDSSDHFFVLPPEYFALSQKKSYLKHYKDEFGSRTGISSFTHKTKTGETVNIDDLFNKKSREEALTDNERTLYYTGAVTKKEDHNVNVVYFSNKYIEEALLNAAKKNKADYPELHSKQRRALLMAKAEAYLSHTEVGKMRLKALSGLSNIDSLVAKGDKLEFANIKVSQEQKEQLKAQEQAHYQILFAEEHLLQTRLPTNQSRIEAVAFTKTAHNVKVGLKKQAQKSADDIKENTLPTHKPR